MLARMMIPPIAWFDFAQDEVNRRWQIELLLILSEVEERTMRLRDHFRSVLSPSAARRSARAIQAVLCAGALLAS
jgi:hypothetical protein